MGWLDVLRSQVQLECVSEVGMGRLHGRNAKLYLKDANGSETEIPIGDWTIEFGSYPSTPKMVFEVADSGQTETD
jgi:hypothetical protein